MKGEVGGANLPDGFKNVLAKMSIKVNDNIKSSITYSATMLKLNSDAIEQCILAQFDKAGLGHNVFTDEAIGLIVRSGDGILRWARNICLSSMLEAAGVKAAG